MTCARRRPRGGDGINQVGVDVALQPENTLHSFRGCGARCFLARSTVLRGAEKRKTTELSFPRRRES